MKVKDKYEDFFMYLSQKGNIRKTITEHRRFMYGCVDKALGACELMDLHMTDVAKVEWWGRDHGRYGGQRAVVSFRQYLRYLKASGETVPFDWRDVEVPFVPDRLPDALTLEELDAALSLIPLHTIEGARTRAMLETLYGTGLRIGELETMQRDQVPWETRELKMLNIKTKEYDMVYFTDRALEWIKNYLSKRNDEHAALFVNHTGTAPLCRITSCYVLKKYLREFGKKIGKPVNHHIFRRTYVTHLLEGGADIKSTQYLARHKSPRTTMNHYIALNKTRAKEVHQQIMNRVSLQPIAERQ